MRAAIMPMLLALMFLPAATASALDANDVVRMTRAGAGDDVIVAQIEATKARFALTADDIVRLKGEGVTDAVLKAMIETAKDSPAPAERSAEAPAGGIPPDPSSPAPDATAQEDGTLVVENLDGRDYSLQVDARAGNVFLWKASGVEWRDPLPARGSTVFRLPAGRYSVKWVGEADGYSVTVRGGGESRIVLTRTSADGGEAAYVSVFEDGQRIGGGRLVVLREARSPELTPAPAVAVAEPAPAAPVVEKHYYYQQPEQYVVYRQAPVRYESRPRYYERRRTDWSCLIPGFAYSWRRGKSNYAVGWDTHGNLGFTYGRKLGRSGYSISWGW